MKKACVILILCFLAIACKSEADKPKKPDGLISKDKMEQVLYDMYIIYGAKNVNRKPLEKMGFVPETYVLTKHNIDSTQFADSNAYYAYNTDIYKKIIENVKTKLEKQKASYEDIQKAENELTKHKRDSINKTRKKKDSIKKLKILKQRDSIKIL